MLQVPSMQSADPNNNTQRREAGIDHITVLGRRADPETTTDAGFIINVRSQLTERAQIDTAQLQQTTNITELD